MDLLKHDMFIYMQQSTRHTTINLFHGSSERIHIDDPHRILSLKWLV